MVALVFQLSWAFVPRHRADELVEQQVFWAVKAEEVEWSLPSFELACPTVPALHMVKNH